MLSLLSLIALSHAWDIEDYMLMNGNNPNMDVSKLAMMGAMDNDYAKAFMMSGQNANSIPWYAMDGDFGDYAMYQQMQGDPHTPSTSSNHASYDLYGPPRAQMIPAAMVNEDLWKLEAWNHGVDPSKFDSEAEFRMYMTLHPTTGVPNKNWKTMAAAMGLNPDMFANAAQFMFYQAVNIRMIGTQPDEKFQDYWETSAQALGLPFGVVTDDSAKESAGAWLIGQGFTDLDAFDDAALKMFGYQAMVMQQNLKNAEAKKAAVPSAADATAVKTDATAAKTDASAAKTDASGVKTDASDTPKRGARKGFNPFDGDAMEYMIYGNFMNGMGFGQNQNQQQQRPQQQRPQQNMWSNAFSNPWAWGMMDGDWEDMAYMGMFNNMWGGYNPYSMWGGNQQQQPQQYQGQRGAAQGINPFDNTPWDNYAEYAQSMNMMKAMNGQAINNGMNRPAGTNMAFQGPTSGMPFNPMMMSFDNTPWDNYMEYAQYMNMMKMMGQNGAYMNPMMFAGMDGDMMQNAYWMQMMGQNQQNQGQGASGHPMPRAKTLRSVEHPMTTCFAILGQLKAIDNGNLREMVIVSAIQKQTVDPLCASQLIKEVDDGKLRKQLRALMLQQAQKNAHPQNAQPARQAASPQGMDPNADLALIAAMKGDSSDMMVIQMILQNPGMAPMLLEQIDSSDLRDLVRAKLMTQAAHANRQAATPAGPTPAGLMALIEAADGDMRDVMVQQAIMNKQVPSYMFPMLLEEMDNGDLREQLTAYLMSLALTGKGTAPAASTPATRQAEAQPSTQNTGSNMPQMAMLLGSMDNGDLRDSYIAKMIMENSVSTQMFPMLLDQIDNGDIKKQIQTYIMTQGNMGGVNPAGLGFVDGDLADFYATQAILNSNGGSLPAEMMPFMDGDIREDLQEQMLWSSIQNNGEPTTRKQAYANPCMNPTTMNKALFFQTFPMMQANPNCVEADMTDCCDDLMKTLKSQGHGFKPSYSQPAAPYVPFVAPTTNTARSRVERKL